MTTPATMNLMNPEAPVRIPAATARSVDPARGPALVVLALFYLAWPLYQVTDYLAALPFYDTLDLLNTAASILAYDWLLLNILLALKLPFLQRFLPYDFRVQTHIVTSVGIGAFVAWHAVHYSFLVPKMFSTVTWSLVAWFPAMLVLALVWVPVPGFRWLHRGAALAAGKTYDVLKRFHKAMYLVLAVLLFVHVLDAKVIGVASPVSSFGFLLLFGTSLVLAGATYFRNLFLPSLRVISVTRRGGIVQLKLTKSWRVRYRAGQFAFLRFNHPSLRGEEHPFSFTSTPHDGTIEFAIKQVGDFTRKLDLLVPGDTVRVNGGFGAFRPRSVSKPLAFIGTGVGVAPLVSLMKDVARRPPLVPVKVVIAASSQDELVEPEWWDQARTSLPWLNLTVLLADRGDPLFSEELVVRELGEPSNYEFYLCSSDRVRSLLVGILTRLGVPGPAIHYENFTLG